MGSISSFTDNSRSNAAAGGHSPTQEPLAGEAYYKQCIDQLASLANDPRYMHACNEAQREILRLRACEIVVAGAPTAVLLARVLTLLTQLGRPQNDAAFTLAVAIGLERWQILQGPQAGIPLPVQSEIALALMILRESYTAFPVPCTPAHFVPVAFFALPPAPLLLPPIPHSSPSQYLTSPPHLSSPDWECIQAAASALELPPGALSRIAVGMRTQYANRPPSYEQLSHVLWSLTTNWDCVSPYLKSGDMACFRKWARRMFFTDEAPSMLELRKMVGILAVLGTPSSPGRGESVQCRAVIVRGLREVTRLTEIPSKTGAYPPGTGQTLQVLRTMCDTHVDIQWSARDRAWLNAKLGKDPYAPQAAPWHLK
jgi:hypothetical protein